MASTGIVVGPVDDPAFGVPFILAVELHRVSCLQRRDSWSEVDVVCDQQGLSGLEFEDEPLMPAPVVVVRQQLDHLALTLDLNPAGSAFNGPDQGRIVRRFHPGHAAASRRKLAILRQPGISGHDQDDEEQEFSHGTRHEKQFGLQRSSLKREEDRTSGDLMRAAVPHAL